MLVSRMRVATFNIRHGEARSGRLDIGLLTRTCAALDADVLGLQEVDKWMRRSRWARLSRRVARQARMAHAFGAALRTGWFGRYGNALLVRGSLSAVEELALPRVSAEPRAALLAGVEVEGVAVSVATTHLSVRTEERDAQLATVVEALARRPPPWLLMGDLNAAPEEARGPIEAAGFRLLIGGPTFPAAAPEKQIDQIAVAGLEAVRCWAEETPISDHRPLLAELSGKGFD